MPRNRQDNVPAQVDRGSSGHDIGIGIPAPQPRLLCVAPPFDLGNQDSPIGGKGGPLHQGREDRYWLDADPAPLDLAELESTFWSIYTPWDTSLYAF